MRHSLFQTITTEDEFTAVANSDIAQLCGETVLLWNVFVEAFAGQRAVLKHLARVYHVQRVRGKMCNILWIVSN